MDDEHTEPTPNPAGPAERVLPVDLRDYADARPDTVTTTRVFATANLGVDLWCIPPRASTGALHDAGRDTAYTVIGGRSWIVTDEGEVGLDPMGAILIPADTAHGIENRAADPLIVLATSSPPGGASASTPVSDAAEAVQRPRPPGLLRRLGALLGGRR